MRKPSRRAALATVDVDVLSGRARAGDQAAARALRARMTPLARQLALALVGEAWAVPGVVRGALDDALRDTAGAYTAAVITAVQKRAATVRAGRRGSVARTPEERLAQAVGVLCDGQGHSHRSAAALLGLSTAEVTALHEQGRVALGVAASSSRCRGWHLVAADELTPAEQVAAAGHLHLCRPCRDALEARAAARARLTVALPVGGTALVGAVVAGLGHAGATVGGAAALAGATAAVTAAGVVAVPYVAPSPRPAGPAPSVPATSPPTPGDSTRPVGTEPEGSGASSATSSDATPTRAPTTPLTPRRTGPADPADPRLPVDGLPVPTALPAPGGARPTPEPPLPVPRVPRPGLPLPGAPVTGLTPLPAPRVSTAPAPARPGGRTGAPLPYPSRTVLPRPVAPVSRPTALPAGHRLPQATVLPPATPAPTPCTASADRPPAGAPSVPPPEVSVAAASAVAADLGPDGGSASVDAAGLLGGAGRASGPLGVPAPQDADAPRSASLC